MEKICGIYLITSPSGRLYIGQSNDIEKRFYVYKLILNKAQPFLYKSFLKYGIDKHSFDIIEICPVSDLNFNEVFYIEYFKYLGFKLLNLTSGGGYNRSKKINVFTGKDFQLPEGWSHEAWEEMKNEFELVDQKINSEMRENIKQLQKEAFEF